MKVRYVGTRPREIVGYGIMHTGDEFECGEATAFSLCDQGWVEPVAPKDKHRVEKVLSTPDAEAEIPAQGSGQEGKR